MAHPGSWHEQYKDYYKDAYWHIAKQILNGACLFHWIMLLRPESILEVGAGSGASSVTLKRLIPDARVVATDINGKICTAIRKLARAAHVKIEVERQDGLALPYLDQSFDVCFSCGLLEHFSEEDMAKVVREQLRVAKYVFMNVPLIHWFLTGMRSMGDELMWPKTMWLAALSRLGIILDFTLYEVPGEEIVMSVAMTGQRRAEFPVTKTTSICF